MELGEVYDWRWREKKRNLSFWVVVCDAMLNKTQPNKRTRSISIQFFPHSFQQRLT